jgi:leucine dehydrogenase
MDVVATRTPYVTGRARQPRRLGRSVAVHRARRRVGDRAACERALGSSSLKGRSVALVGLGHVGLRLARLLARRGAKLLVNDINPARRADAEKLGARWITASDALTAAVDVYCPCALGGVLDDETVPHAAGARRRGRREQPARQRRDRAAAGRARRDLGAGLRRQRRRDHQHRRRAAARGL